MLTTDLIEQILAAAPARTIGVFGDLFLDRYLDLDAALTEPSIETGLDAYQVVSVRSYPGAAGTVISNLAALGVGRIVPISMIGDDGEGYELRQALSRMPSVDLRCIVVTNERRTPTYTKPMLMAAGQTARELNRLDIKNREMVPTEVETKILELLESVWNVCDAILVLDQVSEADCGVVTSKAREHLSLMADPKPVIVDSRERISLFRNVWLKPNERECLLATGCDDLHSAVRQLAEGTQRPVICTRGDKGTLIATTATSELLVVQCYPVNVPIDTVGAGDSSSAAMACALAGSADLQQAAAFGNLIASITIQQIGVTGTASPERVRARWWEVEQARP
jgi:bifunctional ADP-heptose synthase (sugar kinase/adenylyltransferase)